MWLKNNLNNTFLCQNSNNLINLPDVLKNHLIQQNLPAEYNKKKNKKEDNHLRYCSCLTNCC